MQLLPFDASEYLTSPESQTEFIQDAFETADAGYIAAALGVIAGARGMTDVARTAGVTREALHKTLSADGDPKLSTLLGVMKAPGLGLKVGVELRTRNQFI